MDCIKELLPSPSGGFCQWGSGEGGGRNRKWREGEGEEHSRRSQNWKEPAASGWKGGEGFYFNWKLEMLVGSHTVVRNTAETPKPFTQFPHWNILQELNKGVTWWPFPWAFIVPASEALGWTWGAGGQWAVGEGPSLPAPSVHPSYLLEGRAQPCDGWSSCQFWRSEGGCLRWRLHLCLQGLTMASSLSLGPLKIG